MKFEEELEMVEWEDACIPILGMWLNHLTLSRIHMKDVWLNDCLGKWVSQASL